MKYRIIFVIFYLLLGNLVWLGCDESPYEIEMLAYDSQTDSMVYQVNTVTTIHDLDRLKGRATTMLGGLSFELDYVIGEIRWKRVGTPVAFNAQKTNNVYYPEDFDSLAMISIYYNIEQSMLYFESLGMEKGALGGLDTYYWADVLEIFPESNGVPQKEINNAFFLMIDANDRGFYIEPFGDDVNGVEYNGIPFSMNPGVLMHEYSHAVFQTFVYDKLNVPSIDYIDAESRNYLYGLNEGIADVFAVALTGDPDFMRPSLSVIGVTRDASQRIVYTAKWDNDVAYKSEVDFDPYEIGAFVSATLYEIERRLQGLPPNGVGIPNEKIRRNVAYATFNALSILGEAGAENFILPDFFNAFTQLLTSVQQSIACQVLSERYTIHFTEIEVCM